MKDNLMIKLKELDPQEVEDMTTAELMAYTKQELVNFILFQAKCITEQEIKLHNCPHALF